MPLTLMMTPLAQRDIGEIADFIARDNLNAALRFIDTVEETCKNLAEMPELGTLCHFKHRLAADMRVRSIAGYSNYLIFYRVRDSRLEIVRVLHGARDYELLFQE